MSFGGIDNKEAASKKHKEDYNVRTDYKYNSFNR